MLSVFAVAFSAAQPVMLEHVPLTPDILVGRWEWESSSVKIAKHVAATFVYRKDGTYTFEQVDRRTGLAIRPDQTGVYTVTAQSISYVSTTPGDPGGGTEGAQLLPGDRLQLTFHQPRQRPLITVLKKISAQP